MIDMHHLPIIRNAGFPSTTGFLGGAAGAAVVGEALVGAFPTPEPPALFADGTDDESDMLALTRGMFDKSRANKLLEVLQ